jgi:hypothetical protein
MRIHKYCYTVCQMTLLRVIDRICGALLKLSVSAADVVAALNYSNRAYDIAMVAREGMG